MTASPAELTAEVVLADVERRHGPSWDVYQCAETYERLQGMDERNKKGAWYTPQPVAAFTTRFALDIALTEQVGPAPSDVLRINALDPACGVGQFLVEAALKLASALAERCTGQPQVDDVLRDALLPEVLRECVFGVDIDPVAVDLARVVLSRLTGGVHPPEAFTRHVICGDTLAGDEPPAFTERNGGRPAAPVPAT